MKKPPCLFKLELRRLHPEIATAALVLLCQVVLLCKYISSAVFSDLAAESSFPFSFVCCVMQRSYFWRGGSVKYITALFVALHQCRLACGLLVVQ